MAAGLELLQNDVIRRIYRQRTQNEAPFSASRGLPSLLLMGLLEIHFDSKTHFEKKIRGILHVSGLSVISVYLSTFI